jgi:hypothetical protein
MSDRHETALEVAQRHVCEGERRLARQARILDKMERDHHVRAAALAKRVLATMRAALDLQKRHLRQIEAGSKQ